MSTKETIVLSDLLKNQSQKDFTQMSSFPIMKKTIEQKMKEEQNIAEYESKLNELSKKDLVELIKQENLLGQFFSATSDDAEIIYIPSLMHESKQIRVTEQYFEHLDAKDNSVAIKIMDDNSEFLTYLLNIQHGVKYKDIMSNLLKSKFGKINVEQTLENKKIKGEISIPDNDVTHFLMTNGMRINIDHYYINDVGVFHHKDNHWYLSNYPDLMIDNGNLDDFLKNVIHVKRKGSLYVEDAETDVIFQKMKTHYEKLTEELNSIKNKPQYTLVETIDDDFDFAPDPDTTEVIESQINDEDIIGEDVVLFLSDEDEDYMNSLNHYYETMESNNHLTEIIEQNQNEMPPLSLEDEINSQLMTAIMEDADEINYHDIDLDTFEQILYAPDENITSTIEDNVENEYNTNLWENLNSYNIDVERFFKFAIQNNFPLAPKIKEHNGKSFFKTPRYVFKSKSKKEIITIIKDNQWIFEDGKQQGEGLADFIKLLYITDGIRIEEKYAEPFINFIEKNKDEIQQKEEKTTMTTVDIDKHKQNVEVFFSKIENEYQFVIGIQSFKPVDRKGITRNEYKINGQTYRLNNDKWFCIETSTIGNGVDTLIDHAYSNDDEKKQYYSSVNNFIANKFKPVNIESENNALGTEMETNTISENVYEESAPQVDSQTINHAYQVEQVNPESIESAFDELVEIQYQKLTMNKHILDNFKAQTILELSINNNSPYKKLNKIKDNLYAFGTKEKGIYFTIDTNQVVKGSELVKIICDKYPSLQYDVEIERVNKILEPVLKEKIKQKIKTEMEVHQNDLIKEQNPEVVVETIQKKSPQEEYNEMLGFDQKSIVAPIKEHLYDYYLTIQNKNVRLPFKNLIKSLFGTTAIEVEVDYVNTRHNFTIKSPNFTIKGYADNKSEKWEVIDKKINMPNGSNSLIDMFNVMFSTQKRTLQATTLHQAIAKQNEFAFLNTYPMINLLNHFDVQKNGANYLLGDMKIGLTQVDDKEIFKIWNYHVQGYSAISLMQYIMAYTKGYEVSEESVKNNPDLSFKKAKEEIKKLYLSLDNVSKISINNIQSQTKTNEEKEEEYLRMLPQSSINSNIATTYLISRGLSPEILKEMDGKQFYQGEYDKYRNGNTLTVVAFSNGEGATSVRGCTENSKDIKETTPGSSLDKPYKIHPSKKYTYKDDVTRSELVVLEGAIDALSYHCLYPNALKFTNFGLSGTKLILGALKDYYDVVNTNNGEVSIIYAMDNLNLDENGVAIDEASRKAYFDLVRDMSQFCYDKFLTENNEKFEQFEYTNNQLMTVIVEILSADNYDEEQIQEFKQGFHELLDTKIVDEITIRNKSVEDFIGQKLFKFKYVDSGVFKTMAPESKRYGVYKDWNEYLENVVHINLAKRIIKDNHIQNKEEINHYLNKKYKSSVDLELEGIPLMKVIGKLIMAKEKENRETYSKEFIDLLNDIHKGILLEHNQNIIEVAVKKEMKKQSKQTI